MSRSLFLFLLLMTGPRSAEALVLSTSRVPTQATRATSVQELDRDLPRVVLQARTLVQAGDTVAALGLLRRAYADDDDDPHLVFALGTLLARTAPLEETDFEQRLAAEDLLERALRMLPNDAAVLVELAFLKRRQFMRVDARRLLESVVEPGPSAGLDPRIAADAHFVLARILTEEMDDFEHLVFMPSGWREDGATGSDALDPSARCPAGVQYFCYNYSRPRDFNSQFLRASSSTDRGEDYPARIEVEYRAALSYVPDHLQAARGLLGLLYRQGRFAEVSSEASSLAELSPDDPYPHVFGGLARYEAQDWEGAKKLFDVGLSLMSARERAPYDDVSYLLRSRDAPTYEALEPDRAREYERILWSKSDPLFLIPENERRLEHVARVTYAELAFGDPERRLPGWSSDRGQVFIRYGEPERIWMLRQDQQASSVTGRWIFWNYRIDAPSFIFRRQLGYTRVNFDLSANTEAYVRELAEVETSTLFRTRAVNRWTDLPAQVARFRGSSPDLVEVLAFASADPDSFQLFAGDSVATAMFVFNETPEDSASLSQMVGNGQSGNLLFTFELPRGTFDYSIEALAGESRVAGRQRGTLDIVPVPRVGLTASDLLLADAVSPRVSQPGGWRDFSIAASRDLSFEAGEDVHAYFEVYGLTTNFRGSAAYSVEVTVQDAEERSVGTRLIRSLGNVLRPRAGDPTLRFSRSTNPVDGMVAEYLSLTLDDSDGGAHRLTITVTDVASGRSVTVSRDLEIRP